MMAETTRINSLFAKVHAWLGAIASVFIIAVTVTGMAIAFSASLLNLETGAMPLAGSRPAGATVDIASLIDLAQRKAGPDFIPLGYIGPNAEIATTVEMIYGLSAPPDEGGETQIITFDPASGITLGTIYLDRTATHKLIEFHYEFLAGRTGAIFVAIVGLLLVMLAMVGLYLWWPTKTSALKKLRSLTLQKPALRWNFSLHSFFGFWASTVIVIWGLTGVYWSQPDWIPDFVKPTTMALSEEAAKTFASQSCNSLVSVADAVDFAKKTNPGTTLWEAEFAAPWQPYHTIYLSTGHDLDKKDGDVRVWVSSTCNESAISTTVSGFGAIGAVSASIHSGESFGLGRTFVILIVGLMLLLLTVTGLVVWTKKHRQSNRLIRQVVGSTPT